MLLLDSTSLYVAWAFYTASPEPKLSDLLNNIDIWILTDALFQPFEVGTAK